jgi:hypothetical protein
LFCDFGVFWLWWFRWWFCVWMGVVVVFFV